ncbi:MAG: hypothetical protein ACE5FC_03310 [Myxococcota bacterium]
MSREAKDAPLLAWNPFMIREGSEPELETEAGEGGAGKSFESALPAAVEAADEEDAAMAPECFTHWF